MSGSTVLVNNARSDHRNEPPPRAAPLYKSAVGPIF
jgi:hypothetical protein